VCVFITAVPNTKLCAWVERLVARNAAKGRAGVCVYVHYCSTYYKAVRVGEGG
jgi:hypothetical protein